MIDYIENLKPLLLHNHQRFRSTTKKKWASWKGASDAVPHAHASFHRQLHLAALDADHKPSQGTQPHLNELTM